MLTSTLNRSQVFRCKWPNILFYKLYVTGLLLAILFAPRIDAQVPANGINPGTIGNPQTLCMGAGPASLTNLTSATALQQSRGVLVDKPLNLGATNWGYRSSSGDQQIAEDFTIAGPAQASVVKFSGWFYNTNATTGTFDILFFNDAGGIPATVPFASYNTGSINGVFEGFDPSLGGGNIYQWTATIPTVNFAAAGTYWISIRNAIQGVNFAWESATPNGDRKLVYRLANNDAWSVTNGVFLDTDAQAVRIEGLFTGSAAINYQWQSNTAGCDAAFSDIPGATGATYDPGPLNATTYYRRVAKSILNGVPSAANSNCVVLTATACGTPQGCGSGYWKNHENAWPAPYLPAQTLESVFDIPDSYGLDNVKLDDALNGGGGPGAAGAAKILLRAGVAALLKAQHNGVNYARTISSVIQDVNAALASGNRNVMLQLASALEVDNDRGSPLNNSTDATTLKSDAISMESENASKLSAIAGPNPFNERIRFTVKSPVSGQGSIELFNSIGQRLGTAFNGYVTAGRTQVIDYNVAAAQRQNIIYVFRVGDQRVTGKLINTSGGPLNIR